MEYSVSYVGTYKDAFGIVDIVICNDFKKFSLKIEEVEFQGSEFSALEIINKQSYSGQQLERFTLSQTQIYSTNDSVEEICNCAFNVEIPQSIIISKTQEEFVVNMNVEYVLGNKRPIHLGGGLEFEKYIYHFKFLTNHSKVKVIFSN